MSDRIRRRVRVTGHVQGVFFRATTRDVAQDHDVTGWVQNLPDGSVEAEVQGAPEGVEAVEQFLHHGPPRARVDDVTSEDIDVVDTDGGFETR